MAENAGTPAPRADQPPLLARAKEIFLQVRALDAPARAAEVDAACGGHPGLRDMVLMLLRGDHATLPLENLAGEMRAAREAFSREDPGESPGTRLGRYVLRNRIGEGGFGTVFAAEQTEPVRRRVALKIIKLGMDTKQVIARFEAERQALALMDHPNIAKVFDAGATGGGRPYFVMELVMGLPITQYCDARRLAVPARLELFAQVCDALQHAHQKGIIHRDIKPTNVLVSEAGERAVPKVIDFGIAKATSARLTEKTLFTEARQLVGTPEYMSPEQASLSAFDVDIRTDVYSLGVLLYELLTGLTPFDSKTLRSGAMDEMQRIIREVEPPRPSTRLRSAGEALDSAALIRQTQPARLTALIRRELDWVVMKAMEKDRARRYESASALGADVRRYLSGQSVLAVPPSAGYRLRMFARRNRAPVLAGLLVLAALLVGLVGTSMGYVSALRQRGEAVAAKDRAEAERQRADAKAREADTERQRADLKSREALYEAYIANLGAATAAVESGDVAASRYWLNACDQGLRGWEWHYLLACTDQCMRVLDRRNEPIVAAGLDATGSIAVTIAKGGTMAVWDTAHATMLREERLLPGPLARAAVSAGAARAVVCDASGAHVYATDRPGSAVSLPDSASLTALAFSPDGGIVVGACGDGVVRTWSAETGWVLATLDGQGQGVHLVAVTSEGLSCATARPGERFVGLWDLRTGARAGELGPISMAVRCGAFSADGSLFAAGSDNDEIFVYRAADGGVVYRSGGARASIQSIAFSSDGALVVAGSWNATVQIARVPDGAPPPLLQGHGRRVGAVALNAGADAVISASDDGTSRLWSTTDRAGPTDLRGHEDAVHGVAFSPDDRRAVTAAKDGTARIWDVETGREILVLPHPVRLVVTAEFSPDGSRVLTASDDVRVWDAATGAQLLVIGTDLGSFNMASYSPKGDRIVTGGYDGVSRVWDAQSGEPRAAMKTPFKGYTFAAAFSPDGSSVVSGGMQKHAIVWDAASGEARFRLEGHEQWIVDAEFSRDGSRIVTASEDRTVRLWDARDGTSIAVLHGHQSRVGGASFSPDGTRLASVAGDGTLRLWDTARARLVATFHVGGGLYLLDAVFSSDGTRLITVGEEKHARVWDSLARHQRAVAGR